MQISFRGDSGLSDGDVVVLGPDVTCAGGDCSSEQLDAARGIHPYSGVHGDDNGSVPLEREIGHALIEVSRPAKFTKLQNIQNLQNTSYGIFIYNKIKF